MFIWETPILAEIEDIMHKLKADLAKDQVSLLKHIKPTGDNVMITCPFHADGNERHPSMGVSKVDVRRGKKLIPAGTCHCFTCDTTLDLPEMISEVFGRKDKGMTGFLWLKSNFYSLDVEDKRVLEFKIPNQFVELELHEAILDDELEKYRFTHPYMYKRGLTDKVIDYFDIGFDVERQSLTFPVRDKFGDVLFIQRRSVQGKQFLNDETKLKGETLFGLHEVYKNLDWIKEVLVVESPIDALYSWVHRRPAVAQMQAVPTPSQIELLNKLPVTRIISGHDNDDAGRKGAEKLSKGLQNKMYFRINFPEGKKDLNEFTPDEMNNLNFSLYAFRMK